MKGMPCTIGRDADYYRHLEGAKKKALKMGSFDLAVRDWVVDAKQCCPTACW